MLKVSRFSFLLLSICSFAETYAQQFLPLVELVKKVESNAPSLLADSGVIAVRSAQYQAARNNWLPSLRVGYQVALGTNNNLPGGVFSNGMVPSNSRVREWGNSNTILTDLGVINFDWELYNFGSYAAQQRVAASDLNVEQTKFKNTRFEMQQVAIANYLYLVYLNNMLGIQQQNIKRNEDIRRIIHALAVAGVKAGVDTSIAEAELSKARLVELELVNELKKSEFQLSYLSGLPVASIAADTLLQDKLISGYVEYLTMQGDYNNHPLIQHYKARLENSLNRENSIHKMYLPKILLQAALWGRGSSLNARDEFRDLYKGLGFERANYLVGLGITYNIFDLKRKRLNLNIQQAETAYAERKLAQQQAEVKLASQQAQVELTTSYSRLLEIPHQLEAANAAYRQKLSLYKNGLTNIVELNAALNALYRAETDYINVRYQFCKALFQKAAVDNQLQVLLQTLN